MLPLWNLSTKGIRLRRCCLLLLLATRTATGQDDPKTLDALEKRVCHGASDADSRAFSGTAHLQSLRNHYTNCTYVQGNLELIGIDANADLDFLKQIREVSGYLRIERVRKPVLTLPNLRIVRGLTPFESVHRLPGDHPTGIQYEIRHYSVIISHNEGLKELGLAQLREISNGQVYMSYNEQLCHVWSTVNWNDLLDTQLAANLGIKPAHNISGCLPCHKECSTGYCWGPGRDQCQTLTMTICAKQCGENRCRGPDPSDCCHEQCAAGCTGPSASECSACRGFLNDRQCVETCPTLEKYDTGLLTDVPNPDGKLVFSMFCVKECPHNFLRNGQYCVPKCPEKKQEINGACVSCDGPCPKICIGFEDNSRYLADTSITSENLQSFQNCTVIEGNLVILPVSFSGVWTSGNMTTVVPGAVPSPLEELSTIRKITGYLRIEGENTNMSDLSFLRNLETIEGRTLVDARSALIIIGNHHLQSLGLNSLKTIAAGGIKMVDNPMLCYSGQIAWNKILSESSGATTAGVLAEQLLGNNRNESECIRVGEKCHSECSNDGCWGPQQNQCLFCASYQYKSFCLRNCSESNVPNSGMLYNAGNKTCAPCHVQCRDGCTGPSEGFCTTCLNVKDGLNCVTECPVSKYSDSQKVCRPCNEKCRGGCTGPGSFLGEAGCRSCEMGIVSDIATSLIHCLPAEAPCPPRSFQTIGSNETSAFAAMTGKKICQPCHPYCTKCRDSGVYTCQECTYFKVDWQCALTCPNTTHYIEERTSLCLPCHSDCSNRGCTGPLSTQCVSCRTYRDYYNPERPELLNCTAVCPAERKHGITQPSDPQIVLDPSESLCSKVDPASATKTNHIIIGVVVAVVGIIVIVAIVLFFRFKRSKVELETLIIQDKFAGIELTEPLEPTDNKPDTSKLRLISEQELRRGEQLGQGAFGIVYKGFWLPPNEYLRIPVAIKVLKEGVSAGAAKEILEEAHVMASVNNPHLVTLLALCMTSQIMLITQLLPLGSLLDYVKKNKKSITSRTLLNWCSQIAKGMKYLEKRHMIHRDLAARNVLVERPNWVKVTDFGLARMLDCHEESVKSSGGLMPIKWLAPECIDRGVYSHKTDVWAFGVTVWEMLSYGQKPFESTPVKELYRVLQSGERLPQPGISTLDVYMLLLKCWSSHPESRPSFAELVEDFAKMTRDPGRYLVIPGDEYLRLPDYTAEDQQRLFGDMEGSEKLMLAEDYVNPQTAGFDAQVSLCTDSNMKDPDDGPFVPRYTPDPVALSGRHTINWTPKPQPFPTNNEYLDPDDGLPETKYLDFDTDDNLSVEDGKMLRSDHDDDKKLAPTPQMPPDNLRRSETGT